MDRPIVFKTGDFGATWTPAAGNLPQEIIYVIFEDRKNPHLLFVGTYGWSFYVIDISPLQELSEKIMAEEAYLFEVEPKIQWIYGYWGGHFGQRQFTAPNETFGLVIYYYLKNDVSEKFQIVIKNALGEEIRTLRGRKKAGLHKIIWNMRKQAPEKQEDQSRASRTPLVLPGEYAVILEVGEEKLRQKALIHKIPGLE